MVTYHTGTCRSPPTLLFVGWVIWVSLNYRTLDMHQKKKKTFHRVLKIRRENI